MITNTINEIQSSLSQYLVIPNDNFGVNGFYFDVEGETSTNLSSEITDHYTETNEAIQDHIANKPKRVTLKGFVSDLAYSSEVSFETLIANLTNKLSDLAEIQPSLSKAESQIVDFVSSPTKIINAIQKVETNISNGGDIWSLVKNMMPTENKQQQAYMYFKALRDKKILVSLQTPHEFITNMAIESIIAKQAEDSVSISDFTIILKEIRMASTLVEVTSKSSEKAATDSKTALQSAPVTNVGNTQGAVSTAETSNMDAFWQQSRNVLDPEVNRWVNRIKNVPLE